MSATEPPLRPCGLYRPGHNVHQIQANRSLGDDENPPERGRLLHVEPDGLVVIEVDGDERLLWNHDPQRLEQVVTANHNLILHQPRWRMLRSPDPSGESEAFICVARYGDPEVVPCSVVPPSGDPLERLATAGGFLITFDDAKRWVDKTAE
jgi:hypothetical protein